MTRGFNPLDDNEVAGEQNKPLKEVRVIKPPDGDVSNKVASTEWVQDNVPGFEKDPSHTDAIQLRSTVNVINPNANNTDSLGSEQKKFNSIYVEKVESASIRKKATVWTIYMDSVNGVDTNTGFTADKPLKTTGGLLAFLKLYEFGNTLLNVYFAKGEYGAITIDKGVFQGTRIMLRSQATVEADFAVFTGNVLGYGNGTQLEIYNIASKSVGYAVGASTGAYVIISGVCNFIGTEPVQQVLYCVQAKMVCSGTLKVANMNSVTGAVAWSSDMGWLQLVTVEIANVTLTGKGAILRAYREGHLIITGVMTITGTITLGTGIFAYCGDFGYIECFSTITNNGTVTGKRYECYRNGTLMGGLSADPNKTYFPGSIAGTVDAYSRYVMDSNSSGTAGVLDTEVTLTGSSLNVENTPMPAQAGISSSISSSFGVPYTPAYQTSVDWAGGQNTSGYLYYSQVKTMAVATDTIKNILLNLVQRSHHHATYKARYTYWQCDCNCSTDE